MGVSCGMTNGVAVRVVDGPAKRSSPRRRNTVLIVKNHGKSKRKKMNKTTRLSVCVLLLLSMGCVDVERQPSRNTTNKMGCLVSSRIQYATNSWPYDCNVRWTANDLPLALVVNDDAIIEDVTWAVDFINMRVGILLFTIFDYGGHQIAVGHQEQLTEPIRIGQAFWATDRFELTEASIGIKQGLDVKLRRVVIVHELLHTLGVIHDDGCSIMNGMLDLGCTDIAAEDVSALLNLYRSIGQRVFGHVEPIKFEGPETRFRLKEGLEGLRGIQPCYYERF